MSAEEAPRIAITDAPIAEPIRILFPAERFVLIIPMLRTSKFIGFMIVTEIYFKKLETTKGMKIKGNDIVDWFNIMYVSQADKYLTFDNKWRNYILNDDRIKDYLVT